MNRRTVVVSSPVMLDCSAEYMVIVDADKTEKIYLSEISVLIIENTACSVTCALINRLAAKNIKVIFCDERRNPSSELTACYGSRDCSCKIKSQIAWQQLTKERVWTGIVAEKIKNQALLLKKFDLDQYRTLITCRDELELNDATDRAGYADKVYFNALFGNGFRRDSDNPINSALNYGYSLIQSCFNREVVCNGYLTQLGLFRDNMFNQYNLSCDLMEPFRPIIDCKIKKISPVKFDSEEKSLIIPVLNEETVIGGRRNTLLDTIKIYTGSVLDAIESNDVSLIQFPETDFGPYLKILKAEAVSYL